jgi:hypothetical protein
VAAAHQGEQRSRCSPVLENERDTVAVSEPVDVAVWDMVLVAVHVALPLNDPLLLPLIDAVPLPVTVPLPLNEPDPAATQHAPHTADAPHQRNTRTDSQPHTHQCPWTMA